jgi:Uma2 family endonuclease
MSTTTPTDLDTYPYGWRDVSRVADDGTVVTERISLTLEEALAPQEGDVVPEAIFHRRWRDYLSDVFLTRLVNDPTIAVLSDQRVDWGPANIPAYSPDVVVMQGVKVHRNWRTFDLVAEGAEPLLVIEITSMTTAEADLTDKPIAYAKARVREYIVIDGESQRGRAPLRIIAYRLGESGLKPVEPDARGWYWLEAVGVWLGLERGERPRCYDEAGQPILDYPEASERMADQEARIAEQAARIAALEAEVRRLRGAG